MKRERKKSNHCINKNQCFDPKETAENIQIYKKSITYPVYVTVWIIIHVNGAYPMVATAPFAAFSILSLPLNVCVCVFAYAYVPLPFYNFWILLYGQSMSICLPIMILFMCTIICTFVTCLLCEKLPFITLSHTLQIAFKLQFVLQSIFCSVLPFSNLFPLLLHRIMQTEKKKLCCCEFNRHLSRIF